MMFPIYHLLVAQTDDNDTTERVVRGVPVEDISELQGMYEGKQSEIEKAMIEVQALQMLFDVETPVLAQDSIATEEAGDFLLDSLAPTSPRGQSALSREWDRRFGGTE